MTEREAFEAWFDEYDPKLEHDEPDTDDEAEIHKYWMLMAWQASRKALVVELESDCGGRCNAEYDPCNSRITADRIKEI